MRNDILGPSASAENSRIRIASRCGLLQVWADANLYQVQHFECFQLCVASTTIILWKLLIIGRAYYTKLAREVAPTLRRLDFVLPIVAEECHHSKLMI